MWFVVASALLVLVYVVLKPLGDGLTDTSAWAAKIMAPPGTGDNDFTKQYLRVTQAALMDGWLSNVPFFSYNAMVAALVFAALYHWWAAPIVFVVAVFIGTLTKIIWERSVSHYLMFMHARLLSRAATYRQKNDNERAEAAESTSSELQQIIALYMNSTLRPPTAKQLKAMPYGDVSFYLKGDTQAAGVEAFRKGEDFLSKKRMQEALECFDEAIDCGYVDNADVYVMRGSCLQSLGYDLDAIDDFDRAIVLEPEDSVKFYQRSLSKTAASDFRGCVSDLQEAIRLANVDNKYTRGLDDYARETGYKDLAGLYQMQMVRAKISLDEIEGSMREYHEKRANRRRRGSTKNAEE